MAIQDQLNRIQENIAAFLKIHHNDHDTSVNNERAERLERLLEILKRHQTPEIAKALSDSVGKGGTNKPEDVRWVQEKLNENGANLKVDGHTGPKTNNAIAKFQGDNDLPKTRLIEPDDATHKLLSGKDTSDDSNDDNTGDTNSDLNDSVGKGGANKPEDVRWVQEKLNKNGANLKVDGHTGPKTNNAIGKFQSDNDLPKTRLIEPGDATHDLLSGKNTSDDSNDNNTGDTNTDTSRELSSSVGKGGTNNKADVEWVQAQLNANGAKLKVDGDAGPMTNGAIGMFQAKNDLPQTRLIQPGDDTYCLLSGKDHSDDSNDNNTGDTGTIGTTIKDSVGAGGKNNPDDVKVVQKLLKETWHYDNVVINGKGEDVQTVQAIRKFQFRFAGSINTQDGRVDAGGNTWKYLSGVLKPTLEVQTDGTLAGAETDIEKKLAEFSQSIKDIPIDIGGGEIVTVRPPYHMNNSKRRPAIDKAREDNSAVAKIINRMNWNDTHGKATPGAIKDFLQTCVDKGLVKDKTATGMNAFLDKYGITLDCSGLAVQSINYLHDGDLDRDSSDVLRIVNARTLMNNGEVIKAPKDLKAGDMMCIKTHIRLITDVDITDTEVAFTTIESGAAIDLGYGGKRGTDGGDGVGERRWRFRDKNKFGDCERLSGNVWEKKDNSYVYRRITDAVIKKLMGN